MIVTSVVVRGFPADRGRSGRCDAGGDRLDAGPRPAGADEVHCPGGRQQSAVNRSPTARRPPPTGLRITTLVRDTTERAWHDTERKVIAMAGAAQELTWTGSRATAVGQRRRFEPAGRGEVLDTCRYTAPARVGGGAATTWLVGSADDVAGALDACRKLGISHSVLSDTPYRREIVRIGDQLLPRLRGRAGAP
jgi:alkanesulfonate monooxygenase SsuD/methylene tetrahydromethanopterin reductase-like flavin-dependent oxidoreductase (luciferase family)